MHVVIVVCCQVEVTASGWTLVQRSPTKRGVLARGLETSTKRKPRPNLAVEPLKGTN
jgi:hypothetical protein